MMVVLAEQNGVKEDGEIGHGPIRLGIGRGGKTGHDRSVGFHFREGLGVSQARICSVVLG